MYQDDEHAMPTYNPYDILFFSTPSPRITQPKSVNSKLNHNPAFPSCEITIAIHYQRLASMDRLSVCMPRDPEFDILGNKTFNFRFPFLHDLDYPLAN